MLPVEIATLGLVNVFILACLLVAGLYFHALGRTGKALAWMFLCGCAELVLATVSLYFIEHLRWLAGLRIAGRTVELIGLIQLLVHLFRRPAGGVHDTIMRGD